MERYPWIKDCGETTQDALPALLETVGTDDTVLAFFVHCFRATRGAFLREILVSEKVENLLELRAFNAERELWAHRTALAELFQWRVASEAGLTVADWFETRQTLDIDETYPPTGNQELNAFGALRLRTTGGGEYALPIAPGDGCAVLVNYVAYDETGCAFAADWRLRGFAPQETLDYAWRTIGKGE